MPFLQWSDQYRIGIAVFDAEHMRLIAMANEAYDAVLSDTPDAQLRSVFMGLIDYTYSHFEHEERYFAEINYPYTAEHLERHRLLRQQVTELSRMYDEIPKQLLALEVVKFLKVWITEHILGEDLKYGKHLNAQGIF